MSHQENHEELHEHHHHHEEHACCGGGCCGDEDMVVNDRCAKVAYIAQWILLGGAFLFSLLTFILLPRMVRKEIVMEQALKAGGIENYEKLNKEIYETADYKEMMKQQVDMFIQQNKASMEMYKQQTNNPQGDAQIQVDATDNSGIVVDETTPSVDATGEAQ